MLPNYRSSTNLNEIIGVLKRSKIDDQCFLWITIRGKRIVYPIKSLYVNEEHMSFEADFENETDIPGGKELYLKLNYRDTVCKVEVVHSIFNTVTFNLPKEIKSIEMREAYRFKFKPVEKKHITLSMQAELLASASQEVNFQVIDISESGICLMVDEKFIKYFKNNLFVTMVKMQDMLMSVAYELEIIYVKKFRFRFKGKIQTSYRVGLKSSVNFQKSQLDYFTLI